MSDNPDPALHEVDRTVQSEVIAATGKALKAGMTHDAVADLLRHLADEIERDDIAHDPWGPNDSRRNHKTAMARKPTLDVPRQALQTAYQALLALEAPELAAQVEAVILGMIERWPAYPPGLDDPEA